MQDKELRKVLGTIYNGLVLGWDAKNNTFVVYKNIKFTQFHRTVGKGKTIYAAIRAHQKQIKASKPG